MLKILFTQYFKAKDGVFKDLESISERVFEMSSKVMKDYVLKHNEVVTINASKQQSGNSQKNDNNQEQALSNLHEAEL